MDMDWHKEFIKMPHKMAKDCYMSPQDTIAVQRSIRIFLMREKILQTSGCSAVQYLYNFFLVIFESTFQLILNCAKFVSRVHFDLLV